MKKLYYLISMSAVLSLGACQNEEEWGSQGMNASDITIEASLENGAESRTALNSGKVFWEENDALSVFLGNATNQQASIIKETMEDDCAQFKMTAGSDVISGRGTEDDENDFANVAYYPYAEGVTVVKGVDNYIVSAVFPAEQTFKDGSFGTNVYPMVAVGNDFNFGFKNVAGMIHIPLKGSATIVRVTVESKNHKLAGNYQVTASANAAPTMEMASDAVNSITLDCGEGVPLDESTAIGFDFVLPVGTYEGDDLTFTFYDNNNGYMEFVAANEDKVERSKRTVFDEKTYRATGNNYAQDVNGNLSIYTAEGMKYFYEQLIAKNTYSGKTVTLMADINMNGVEWVSKTADASTSFAGTLDGNNKIISNFTATTSAEGGYATMFNLFSGEVKNLTLDGVTATDNNKNGRASALVGYMSSGNISGVNVKDATISGYQKVAGLVSYPCDGEIVIENCQIENVTLKASTEGGTLWQSGGLAGYASNYTSMSITGCSVKDITFEGAATAEACGALPFYCHPFIGCIDYSKEDTEATVILSNNTVSGTNTETDVYSDANSAYYGYGKHRSTGKLTITIDVKQVWPALVAEVNGTSYETLADAFTAAGEAGSVKVLSGTYTIPTSIPNGMTIEGEEGVVFAGTSSVSGENVTIKNVVFRNTDNATSNEYRALTGNLKGTTFENCVFDARHGARYCYADGTVTFKDCTFGNETCSRGLHFDGGSGNVIVEGCTLYGSNALGESLSKVTFKNCNIKVSSGSTFNGVNMYNVYEYENCTFDPGTYTDCTEENSITATYTNCKYADNSDIKNVVRFDGDPAICTITFDGKAYVTTSESLSTALQNGGEVVLSEGEYTLPSVSNSQVAISGTKETEKTMYQAVVLL